MATPEDDAHPHRSFDTGPKAVSSFVLVAALGLIAAGLVGISTYTAVQAGYAALGLGFLVATVPFVATLAVFEVGRRAGLDL